MLELRTQPLTREQFAPFGDVIQVDDTVASFPINAGSTKRYHDQCRVETLGAGARPAISLFRSQPRSLPITLDGMERHPLGSQAFMPVHGDRFVVVVAPPGEPIRAGAIRAFITDGAQGVNYHPGVWHHPMLALDRISDFLVVDRVGPEANCDERPMPEPMMVLA